jgi:hypothetical protein
MPRGQKPRSFDNLSEAMEVMRADAQPWIKPIKPANPEERANSAREQAQRLLAVMSKPVPDMK